MRPPFAGMLATAACSLLAVALGAAGGSEPGAAPDPETTFTTTVEGTVPDLAGRWLNVAQVKVGTGGGEGVGIAVPYLWEVGAAADGAPRLRVRYVALPARLASAVEAANKEGRAWEPDLRDLRELRAHWDRLAPEPRGVANVTTTITGRDSFPDAIASDENMRDAEFVVQIAVDFAPGQARPIREALIYGATAREPLGFRGNYAGATIAAAPFPISIPFKGTFRLYRLEDVPEASLLERIAGWFAGCGRSPSGP